MATASVQQLEKTAGLGLAEHEFNTPDAVVNEKDVHVTESSDHGDAVPQKPSDVESIDSDQPNGLIKMEAITLVWTKNWLIAAYAA